MYISDVTITGTVIVTRNNIPWNLNNYPNDDIGISVNIGEVADRAVDSGPPAPYNPPRDRPSIFAKSKSRPEYNVAEVAALYSSGDDLVQGRYSWSMKVPYSYVPGMISFQVLVPTLGTDYIIELGEIWVENTETPVDLGTVNFNMTRIWGNLPVTFNGNPPTDNRYSFLYRKPEIIVKQSDGANIGRFTILPDGKWLMDIKKQDSEIELEFSVEAMENGGIFRKNLNPNHLITVHNTDKEIVFPDYPVINFEAFTLSGTVFLPVIIGTLFRCEINFYNDDLRVAFVRHNNENFRGRKSGEFEWSTMIPSFSFPKELTFTLVYAIQGNERRFSGSIEINEDNDLENINLGTSAAEYTCEYNGTFNFILREEEHGKITIIGANAVLRDELNIPAQINGLPVTDIGESAFARHQLTHVTIPNSVINIGRSAFNYNRLSNVIIPDSVKTIGRGAFLTNQLTQVTIPVGITIINDSMFGSNQLTQVTIPNNITSIEENAFIRNQLSQIIIADSVTSIGAYAFFDNQLIQIIIPGSVRVINSHAFARNYLTNITIGADVDISTHAFNNYNWSNSGFVTFYNDNGRLAGTYSRDNTSSTVWTRN